MSTTIINYYYYLWFKTMIASHPCKSEILGPGPHGPSLWPYRDLSYDWVYKEAHP